MHGDMTPEVRSLMLFGDVSQRMLAARDAAMQQDGRSMMLWLQQARERYEQYLRELTTMCERLPQ